MPLKRLLKQNEQIKELVHESAAELSSANSVLKNEVATQQVSTAVAEALQKSEAVEIKVDDASQKLTAVNRALVKEIHDGDLLNLELAATREQHALASHAALHDELTGLPNRALFEDRLEHGISMAQRHDWMMAVMFLDLDKFKAINDTHGHEVGDAVLKMVAQRLTGVTRGDDTVSRFGGDEFLYLETEILDEGNITPVAEKILAAIRAPMNIRIRGSDFNLSIDASIGISVFPKHGKTADELIQVADQAMYCAKNSGSGYALTA